jgi:phage terminase small subunit
MKEIVKQLEEAGTLKDVNTSTLDMLAQTYDRYIKANDQVDEEG